MVLDRMETWKCKRRGTEYRYNSNYGRSFAISEGQLHRLLKLLVANQGVLLNHLVDGVTEKVLKKSLTSPGRQNSLRGAVVYLDTNSLAYLEKIIQGNTDDKLKAITQVTLAYCIPLILCGCDIVCDGALYERRLAKHQGAHVRDTEVEAFLIVNPKKLVSIVLDWNLNSFQSEYQEHLAGRQGVNQPDHMRSLYSDHNIGLIKTGLLKFWELHKDDSLDPDGRANRFIDFLENEGRYQVILIHFVLYSFSGEGQTFSLVKKMNSSKVDRSKIDGYVLNAAIDLLWVLYSFEMEGEFAKRKHFNCLLSHDKALQNFWIKMNEVLSSNAIASYRNIKPSTVQRIPKAGSRDARAEKSASEWEQLQDQIFNSLGV